MSGKHRPDPEAPNREAALAAATKIMVEQARQRGMSEAEIQRCLNAGK